ncbi:MAG TPA: AAA family ATPase [Pseudonocardiaceae bacterium]
MNPQIVLTARLSTSALDARRGVVRLHREVLAALGLRQWDAVTLTGARTSAALAAAAPDDAPPGVALLDDVTLSNVGLREGAEVAVRPVEVAPARTVTVAGSRLAATAVPPETLRLALLDKVLTTGDAVSLLPQDLTPGSDAQAARHKLASAIGLTWTNELLTVTATEPAGPVAIAPATVVGWRDGPRTGTPPTVPARRPPGTTSAATPGSATPEPDAVAAPAPVPVGDLVGAIPQARRLGEWLELAFRRPDLLRRLGSAPKLGVLVSGPSGVGKTTLVRSVADSVDAAVVELAGPSVAAVEAAAASQLVHDAVARASASAAGGEPCVLLITDAEALLPASDRPPLATLVLDVLRAALGRPGLALVVTSSHPESVDPRLRDPDLVDRELSVPLPDGSVRRELLAVLLRDVPLAAGTDLGEVAERTPGFVAADLVALRREAAVRAALRHQGGDGDGDPTVSVEDLLGALDVVRPISMSSSENLAVGTLTLDEVGDMVETKQALTEAVLWPLRYPDSFARLGVDPPRGVLLYGPPGCGKTFLVRALAGSGRLNVFSVKGAELLDKWVGESERAVRDLFRRAADAAPALVFLDEVDALAPRRGQSGDSGVGDRVVAALLTELDGVEPLREVVVLGATNRPDLIDPALLRPGRLERLVFVPPPDADARAEILRAAARNTPLAADVDLTALAAALDGYSAADCTALVREAALTAMRESLDATVVTAAHVAAAREAVRPSLDPAQVAALAAYAAAR